MTKAYPFAKRTCWCDVGFELGGCNLGPKRSTSRAEAPAGVIYGNLSDHPTVLLFHSPQPIAFMIPQSEWRVLFHAD